MSWDTMIYDLELKLSQWESRDEQLNELLTFNPDEQYAMLERHLTFYKKMKERETALC